MDETTCRICLNVCHNVISIFTKQDEDCSPYDKLHKLKLIQITDPGSCSICSQCLSELNICIQFFEKCEKSIKFLTSYSELQNDTLEPQIKLEQYSEYTESKDLSNPTDDASFIEIETVDQDTPNDTALQNPCAECGSLRNCPHKQFNCQFCGKVFNRRYNFDLHVKRHLGILEYPCDYCGALQVSKWYAMYHCSRKMSHVCPEPNCSSKYTSAYNLTVHMRKHTGERPYECDDCGKRFTLKSTLIHHIRTHTGTKPYMCSICGAQFATNKLAAHMKTHDETTKPRKPKPQKRPRTEATGSQKEHVYKCPVCPMKSFRSWSVIRHLKKHHPHLADIRTTNKRIAQKARKHICAYCPMRYMRRDSLTRHLRKFHPNFADIHTTNKRIAQKARKHICAYCPMRYMRRDNLTRHLRKLHPNFAVIHATNKRIAQKAREFKCAHCSMQYSHKMSLTRHLRKLHPNFADIHTTNKRIAQKAREYICAHCPMRYMRRESLIRHLRKLHPNFADIRPYVQTTNKRIAHKAPEYKCAYCPRQYPYKTSLTRHLKNLHSNFAETDIQSFIQTTNKLIDDIKTEDGKPPEAETDIKPIIQTTNILMGDIKTEDGKPLEAETDIKPIIQTTNILMGDIKTEDGKPPEAETDIKPFIQTTNILMADIKPEDRKPLEAEKDIKPLIQTTNILMADIKTEDGKPPEAETDIKSCIQTTNKLMTDMKAHDKKPKPKRKPKKQPSDPETTRSQNAGAHKCKICSMRFVSRNALTGHVKKHHRHFAGIVPYMHAICGPRFTPNKLMAHMKTNDNDKKPMPQEQPIEPETTGSQKAETFECPGCARLFSHKQSLQRHLKKCHLQCTETTTKPAS